MAKELIISANVHEKKVAILEDGVVTEFYVERRDENQGVVGNLYKGRVMKVLPGMQSAFVDIGLERDAFLYVSDFTEFMEEEEEIDFRETIEEKPVRPEEKTARPDDRPRRQEQRRPGVAAKPAPTAIREEEPVEPDVRYDDIVEQLAEMADESVIPPPLTEDEIDAQSEEPMVEAAAAQVEEFHIERITDEPYEEAVEAPAEAEAESVAETTQAAPGEEATEAAAVEAEEEKPRRRPRKKAAEKPEPKSRRKSAKAETGKAEGKAEAAPAKASARKSSSKTTAKKSRRGTSAEAAAGAAPAVEENFQRITDDDMAGDAGDLLKDAIVQEKIIERVHKAEYATPPVVRQPEPEWRVGSFRAIDEDEGFQRVVDESAPQASNPKNIEATSVSQATEGEAAEEGAGTPFRHISEALPGWLRERMDAVGFNQSSAVAEGEEAGEAGAADEDRDGKERDAEVRDRTPRAEFSQRRGGRGRRRRHQGPPPTATGAAGEETIEGDAEAESAEPAIEEAPRASAPRAIEEAPRASAPRASAPRTSAPRASAPRPVAPRAETSRPRFGGRGEERRSDDRPRDERPRDERPRDGRGDGRTDRRPDPRGDQRQETQRPPSRRAERGGPPTISELLHEGQEILVQIAKEPIAKKGARITSHIALPGRYVVYMPTVNHVGVSRKIPSDQERLRLKRIVSSLREREGGSGGFIARTACAGHTEQELQDDMRYLLRTWADVRKKADRAKAPSMVHQDLDLVQRILRDQISDEFSVIRIDNEVEYARIVEFVHRVQPRMVNRVKLYTGNQPIFEKYGVQPEIDKAVRPRVWLKSGGYIVINQTEALVAIDVNTGKFVGKSDKLEDTITRTNLEAVKEIVRQIRLRDLGGIIVLDLIDMEERKNRQRVMTALQQELAHDRAPSKILSINDFGLVAITRKRVKQSLERTLCSPCPYCTGAGMVKSAQTMCFEILEQAKAISKQVSGNNEVMLRVSPQVADAFRSSERAVFEEVEAHFNSPITLEPDPNLHQEQYDFAVM
jgi:ribonuclease G